MIPTIITPKVGFKNESGIVTERVCFPLQEISAEQELDFLVSVGSLKDKDAKEQIELGYQMYVKALSDWVVEVPYIVTLNKEGDIESKAYLDSGDDPKIAIETYFAEPTMRKNRILNSAINSFLGQISADVVF